MFWSWLHGKWVRGRTSVNVNQKSIGCSSDTDHLINPYFFFAPRCLLRQLQLWLEVLQPVSQPIHLPVLLLHAEVEGLPVVRLHPVDGGLLPLQLLSQLLSLILQICAWREEFCNVMDSEPRSDS